MFRLLCIFAIWIGWSGYQPTRGKSTTPSILYMVDVIKSVDNMAKIKPLAQVLAEFRNVHGNRYVYTEINMQNYFGSKKKVPVTCKKHGIFFISVENHKQGQGCPKCASIQRKISNTGNYRKRTHKVYGVGINDYEKSVKCNNVHIPSYHTWVGMLKRCYCKKFLSTHNTYKSCYVCSEWLYFSNFKTWFDDNYISGYCLDKDILVKGNKVYSPETCCFVPNEINVLLCKSDKQRGDTPIGVHKRQMVNGLKYVAYLNNHIKKHFHLGTFNTIEEAFHAYKSAKEAHIQKMATQYYKGGKITKSVYDALIKYKVEITD